jgi:hypothetical protein
VSKFARNRVAAPPFSTILPASGTMPTELSNPGPTKAPPSRVGRPPSAVFCFWASNGQEKTAEGGHPPLFAVLLVCFVCAARLPAAEPHRVTFDDPRPSWNWASDPADVRLLKHERSQSAGRESSGERVMFLPRRADVSIRLEHHLPACRVLDELETSVWIRPTQPGWTLAVRVIAPGIRNPTTGEPASFLLRGDVARTPERWQQLRCRTTDHAISQQIRVQRARYEVAADPGELFIDQVVLLFRAQDAVETALAIDDLEVSPVVLVEAASATEPELRDTELPSVEFPLQRLQVGGRPFFPRIVRDHGEPMKTLADSGCNLIWIEADCEVARLRSLRSHGLWAMAMPPRPQSESGDVLGASSAGLVPFSATTDPILCWLMGVRLGAVERERTVEWIEQVHAADRRRNRPIVAEVVADERLYSRDVQMLGLSRHVLQSTFSLPDYRDWLAERRALARPGAFCWTWIQCESSPVLQQSLSAWATPPQLEPEQIRLQVYAALGAGCRGIGYWTTQPLDGATPAQRELALAIQQINQELSLLEPWLATVGGVSHIPCQIITESPQERTDPARRVLEGASATARNLIGAGSRRQDNLRSPAGLSATVLRTDFGTLVLPVWLDPQSQFVPAPAAAQSITFVVPGAEESAAAYEVSTTRIASLSEPQRERVAGGKQITLSRFDQSAVVWLTSDQRLVEAMRQRIAAIEKSSATVSIELARRKIDRVGTVDARLQEVGARQEDGAQIIGGARLRLEKAQAALQSRDYHTARLLADDAARFLRMLQRAHWDDAVKHLSSPASSPYTLCFQSLPDHWRLVGHVGRSRQRDARNLLASGEFEDYDTLVAENWEHTQTPHEGLHAGAELVPGGHKSRTSLRLTCVPMTGVQPPVSLTQPAVTVITPPLHVRAGQILHISGWVKLDKPIVGSRDGFQISESLLGRSGAVRYRTATDWVRFEMLREVIASGDWKLTLSLTGIGDARIDDLQVLALDPLPDADFAAEEPTIQPAGGLLDKLPRFPGLPTRRRD